MITNYGKNKSHKKETWKLFAIAILLILIIIIIIIITIIAVKTDFKQPKSSAIIVATLTW